MRPQAEVVYNTGSEETFERANEETAGQQATLTESDILQCADNAPPTDSERNPLTTVSWDDLIETRVL